MELREIYSRYNQAMDLKLHFTSFGIFAKNQTLDYHLEECDNWVIFNNKDNRKSFAAHDLELGLNESA